MPAKRRGPPPEAAPSPAPPRAPARRPARKPSAAVPPPAPAPRHLISRAEMARKVGLSRAAVTLACRDGGRLAPACDGGSINVLHEAAQRWLLERSAALEPPQRETARRATQRQAAQARAARPEPEPELRTPRRRPAPEPEPEPAKATRRRPPPDPVELPPIGIDDDPPEPSRPIDSLEAELGPRQRVNLAELAEPLTALTERYGDVREFEGWIRARKALEEARKAQMLRERLEQRLIARTTVVRMFDHIDTAFRLLLSDAPRSIATRIAPQSVAEVAALIRETMSQHLVTCRTQLDQSLANDDPMAALAEAAE